MTIHLTVTSTDPQHPIDPCRYSFDCDEVLIGRDEATDVRLPHDSVSAVHLRIVRRKGRIFAVDGGSTNGALLDGAPLEPGRAVELTPGACLTIGPFEVAYTAQGAAASESTAPADTAQLARKMVLQLMGQGAADALPSLMVMDGPQRGACRQLRAQDERLVVGRGERCDLRLEDADTSREHLEIRRVGGQLVVADLGSKNGVTVNGEPLQGPRPLSHGDTVRLGNTRLELCDPAARLLLQLDQREDQVSAVSAEASATAGPEDDRGPQRPSLSAAGAQPGQPRSTATPETGVRASGGDHRGLLLALTVGVVVLCALAGAVWLLL